MEQEKLYDNIELIRQLAEEGFLQREIGEKLGCSRELIKIRCKKFNIKTKGTKQFNKDKKIGETNTNKWGSLMEIVQYEEHSKITVRFARDGYIKKCKYTDFAKGVVKHPDDITISKVGYVGIGDYKVSIDGKQTQHYSCWSSMLRRCYSSKRKKDSTYKNVSVCEEWHNFQNFAKWYDENYYEIENEKICLDKDILKKGNKIYCPEFCVFVPSDINSLFIKSDIIRGSLPIGVSKNGKYKNYKANCSIGKTIKYLGLYPTPEKAFEAYRIFKEGRIKKMAELYKNKIPERLYEAMYKYKVEITD